jgi:hypothetical protein
LEGVTDAVDVGDAVGVTDADGGGGVYLPGASVVPSDTV